MSGNKRFLLYQTLLLTAQEGYLQTLRKCSLFLKHLNKRGNSQPVRCVHTLLVEGLANPSFTSQLILAELLLGKPSLKIVTFAQKATSFCKHIGYMGSNNIVQA